MSVALFKNNDVIAGRITRTYTYGPGVDNIQSMTIYDEYGGSETYYYIKDVSNTVQILINGNGEVVEYYYYDAFGNVKIWDENNYPLTESQYGNRFLFQGREYDYDTALYYFRARWYEPETGRWLSPDPIGISGGLNLYAFCGNDPVNFVDPKGLEILVIRNDECFGHEYLKIIYSDGTIKYLQANPTDINEHVSTLGCLWDSAHTVFWSQMKITIDTSIDKKLHSILHKYKTTDKQNDQLLEWVYENYDVDGKNDSINNPKYSFPFSTCRNFSKKAQKELEKIIRVNSNE